MIKENNDLSQDVSAHAKNETQDLNTKQEGEIMSLDDMHQNENLKLVILLWLCLFF